MGTRRQRRPVAASRVTGPAFDRIVDELERRGHRVRRHGNYAQTRCTHAGADNPEGLSVFDNGSRVRLTCFTRGCDGDEIAESLGLTWKDLYDQPQGDALAVYRYDDGRTVHRKPGKKFHQTNTQSTPTLYHASRLAEAIKRGDTVYLVEGEEDVHSLEAVGQVATTAPMGARNFDKVDCTPLRGAKIIAIPDNDEEGTHWAEIVRDKLAELATVRFARPAKGKDASDHLAAGLTVDQFEDETKRIVFARYPALNLDAVLDPNRPPREFLISGLIPAGAAVSLAAPAGTGKSLLTLAIALAVARGNRSFAGLAIPRPHRVLYVDMENTTDDLGERFESLGIRRGDSLGHLTYLSLPELPPLDTRAGGSELLTILDAYNLGPGDLVVLDSLQRVIEGEENASDTMRAFYLCTGIHLKRARYTSLRLDNTGKDITRGSRGTSGKRDDVDLELVMIPDEDDDEQFKIAVNKSRLSDISPLTITRTVDGRGQTIFSTGDDPFRGAVNAAKDELSRHRVPVTASLIESRDALRSRNFTDKTIRTAVRERRSETVSCSVCHLPMTSLGDAATTHPGCE